MPYFVKVEDPDNAGQFIYTEVSDTDIVIDDAVLAKKVVEHPKYRDVLDESKARKLKLRELRAEMDKLAGEQTNTPEGDGNIDTENSSNSQQVVVAPPLDEDALYQKFQERTQKERAAAELAAAQERDRLAKLIVQHKLDQSAISLLANAKDPDAMAASLATTNYRFDDTLGGAPGVPDKDALQAKILENLGLADKT